MPQATIKLQQAPAPVATKKPVITAASETKTEEQGEAKATVPVTDDETSTDGGVPTVLLMAAAALALVAFGIQVWLFIS